MKISIIGTGNVAHVLGRLCRQAGHQVVQVYGRHAEAANRLAAELDATPVSDWNDLGHPEAIIYIVALPDTLLPQLHQWWQAKKGLVVHTAGAVSLDALQAVAANHGVLYPLQTIRRERMPVTPFPLLVNANTPDDLALLADFAASLTGQAAVCTDADRLRLHLAAVLANNFTNHLWHLAMQYCRRHGLDPDWLKPLIRETAARIEDHEPAAMQTGPAIRGDQSTIDKHLALLADDPQLATLYRWFTDSIQSSH